jgi:LysM repeat protein
MISFPNKRYLLLLLGACLFPTLLVAQEEPVRVERTNNKVILEGTVYYIHVVSPGETLYAISKAYNISQKEIAIENPGAISGLQIGQSLKIPVEPKLRSEVDTSELPQSNEPGKFHAVKPGETLYGIARMYGLREKQIELANRGVSAANLQPGQRLKIPDAVAIEEEPSYNEEGFVYHKVKRRETLYSIAGYYGVSIEEIRSVNPELGWGGPKTGQMIKIPELQMTGQQRTEDIIARSEESPNSEEQPNIDDYDYRELEARHDNINRTYRVAFFIPFDFEEMEPLDSLVKNVESETRRSRITERYMVEHRIPQSVRFLEFFQGTLMAIDSMRQTGMKLDVRYFDTRRSMSRTQSILQESALENFDLFVGPFYPYNLEIVSAFARQHRIPLITPFYNELDMVSRDPYLFQLSPSVERGYREAAKLVASKHAYNIIYVRLEDSLDVEKHAYFKQLIFDGFEDYHLSDPPVFKEVVLELKRTDAIIHSLSHDKKNLVVVPTDDEALASSVVTSLFHQLKSYDIEVIGSPFWTGFSTIDLTYYHKLNLMFYSSFWVDYHDPVVEEFLTRFRRQFYNEPTETSRKGSNYGIMGHDITLYFLDALRIFGPRFLLSLDEYRPGLVRGPFTFERISRGGGYENTHLGFYRFSPDMTIQQFEVPEPEKRYYFQPMEDRVRRRYLNRERMNN